jgi:hypothetical protein
VEDDVVGGEAKSDAVEHIETEASVVELVVAVEDDARVDGPVTIVETEAGAVELGTGTKRHGCPRGSWLGALQWPQHRG